MNELTDKQIKEVYEEHASDDPDMHLPFARAIIAADRKLRQGSVSDDEAAMEAA